MFPTRITAYRLSRPISVASLNDLHAALSMQKYRELARMELSCDGFVPPMPRYRPDNLLVVVGHSELRWHREFELGDEDTFGGPPPFNEGQFDFKGFGSADSDALVMRYYREEKSIVTSDIKRKVRLAVEEIEREQTRKVYAKERGELKRKFIDAVLPGAQAKYQEVPIVLLSAGFVIIGAVGKLADQAACTLREILGTFPLIPLRTKHEVYHVLTAIARAQADDKFDRFRITSDFQMQETHQHPAVARCKNTDITDENIQGFMRAGKVVTHADMLWDDKVSFSIDPKLTIRKLRVDDAVFEEVAGDEEEESLDMGSVDYASDMIEAALVLQMLVELLALLGGEELPTASFDGPKRVDDTPLVLTNLASGKAEAMERQSPSKAAEGAEDGEE